MLQNRMQTLNVMTESCDNFTFGFHINQSDVLPNYNTVDYGFP